MNDLTIRSEPPAVAGILADTEALGFGMASEPGVGALLAVLAASKPGGRFLELGTGTGHGTAWLLSGMNSQSTLDTVDSDSHVVEVAKRHLGSDARVTFHVMDGAEFLAGLDRVRPTEAVRGTVLPAEGRADRYDIIYADAWPGKFSHLEEALSLLAPSGIYVIDDLLPQPNWPDGHAPRVPRLLDDIEHRDQFVTVRLAWASGVMLAVRKG